MLIAKWANEVKVYLGKDQDTLEFLNNSSRVRDDDFFRLKTAFAKAFDPSWAFQKATDYLQSGVPAGLYLGGGVHFQAWKQQHLKTPLVIKVSKHRWGEAFEGGRRLEQQYTVWKHLSKQNLWLVPPFEVFRCEDAVVMVMLWGEEFQESRLEGHWKPWREQVHRFDAELKTKGLQVNDALQWKVWDGVPFLCDLSDMGYISKI